MSSSENYAEMELECAKNFCAALSQTKTKQLIYLSGIVNQDKLSEHLRSRKRVELELSKGSFTNYPTRRNYCGLR